MFLLRRIASRKRAEQDALRHLEEIEELLEQGHFSRAYKKAEKALADGNDKERCLRILGDAAYGLRKWGLSVVHYGDLLTASPSNKHAEDGFLTALSRLDEARTGNYYFEKLYDAALEGEMDVDVADYVGPIKVVNIPGKGKGTVATRDVKKGTLLLVSKAFATATSSMGLVNAMKEKLKRQPEMIAEVADLYYGRERDTAKAQKSDWRSVTHKTRLERICWYNTFKAGLFNRAPENQMHGGLWILPSYFNHSCLPNTRRAFYGDTLVAFAAIDIKQGEELTFCYVPLEESYEHRKRILGEGYDVVCDCRLCEVDREDPRRQAREELTRGTILPLIERPQTPATIVPILTRLVDQIRETYDRRSELKTQLYWPFKALGDAHQKMGEYAEAVKYFDEAVKCVPESMMPVWGVWAYVPMAECCDLMRRPRTARRFARTAADLHRTSTGHDDELFTKIYTDIAHLLGADLPR
ncbi:TPR domain-containing protein [Aphelenchoides avenae]|nr:TPR domain-containing protein [Aphelenchus avenae]